MKKQQLLIAFAIAIAVYLGLSLLGSTRVPPIYTIESEIVLPATPAESWDVLTDLAKYPDWNPYVTRAEIHPEFAANASISFTVVDENFASPLDLTAQLGEVLVNERFHWVGTLGIRGVHDTRHGFSLEPMPDGRTRLRQYEEFRGALAWLIPWRAERMAKTQRSFEKMNRALAERLADSNG